VVSYAVELARSRDKSDVMINQLLDTIEYSSAIAAYTNNEQIAKDVIQGLMRNDIVQKVKILGDQNLHLEQAKQPPSSISSEIIRPLHSPFDNRQVIGSISVVPSSDYNLVEATHSAVLSAINSFLLIILTTAMILWVLRRNILQPLMVVSDTLHDISAGEKQRIVPLSKHLNDELGRLVVDINALLDTLEIKFQDEHNLREKIESIEKQLRNIFESTSAGLFQLDRQGKLLTYNPTCLKFLVNDERQAKDLIGYDFSETFLENAKLFKDMLRIAGKSKNLVSNDLALRANNNTENQRWMHCLLSRIDDPTSGQALFEGVIFDISSRIAKENAIRYQAEYDALTGVLRRDSIECNLALFLDDPKRWPLVLMLLDLDGFKAVNDNHGHGAGDEVLVEVTQRFKNNIRATDVVGRMGGDEFLIILTKCELINAEHTIAKKIIQATRKPIVLKSKQIVNIGVSIGMVSNKLPDLTVETLIKAADDAMYKVKRQGKNGFALYKGDGDITVESFADQAD
jgi:diguanylate cyclase (GGDEF)-like protein/PAS domain S-box-containing protein